MGDLDLAKTLILKTEIWKTGIYVHWEEMFMYRIYSPMS